MGADSISLRELVVFNPTNLETFLAKLVQASKESAERLSKVEEGANAELTELQERMNALNALHEEISPMVPMLKTWPEKLKELQCLQSVCKQLAEEQTAAAATVAELQRSNATCLGNVADYRLHKLKAW